MSASGAEVTSDRTDEDRNRAIGSMVAKDRMIATGFVGLLWLLIIFVLLSLGEILDTAGVRIVLIAAALVQVVLVTGGVVSLIRHNSSERLRIYGPDLDHSDFNRAAKRR